MQSKPTHAIAIVAFLASLIADPSFAQQSPRDLYERARILDESNQSAIRLYLNSYLLPKPIARI